MADAGAIPAEGLRAFVARALEMQGVPEADAATVAGLMVEADIYGYGTHGVFRLRQYLARLKGGGCNPAPKVSVVQDTVATAVIDGDDGLGHLAMATARDLAIEKARAAGVEVLCFGCRITPEGVWLDAPLPFASPAPTIG